MSGIFDVVAISCDTLAPVACCVGDTAISISKDSQIMSQELSKGLYLLPMPLPTLLTPLPTP